MSNPERFQAELADNGGTVLARGVAAIPADASNSTFDTPDQFDMEKVETVRLFGGKCYSVAGMEKVHQRIGEITPAKPYKMILGYPRMLDVTLLRANGSVVVEGVAALCPLKHQGDTFETSLPFDPKEVVSVRLGNGDVIPVYGLSSCSNGHNHYHFQRQENGLAGLQKA